MIPIGTSRVGFLASSAWVETESKPMYAKKMMAAPEAIPLKPFGAKGVQCSGLTNLKLTKTKKASTTSLIATIQKLKLADSRIPHTSTTVSLAVPPVMVSEDFGRFGDDVTPKIPVFLYWLGSVDPSRVAQFAKDGKTLPTLHSSGYYPLPRPTIATGIMTMSSGLLGLMK